MEPSPDGRTKATRPARNNRRPQDAQSGDRLGAGWLADALSDDAKDAGPASKSTPPAAAQPDLGLGPQWARSDPAPDDPNPAIADPQTAVPTSTRRAGGSS